MPGCGGVCEFLQFCGMLLSCFLAGLKTKVFNKRLHSCAIYYDFCKGLIVLNNDLVNSELCDIQAASKYLHMSLNDLINSELSGIGAASKYLHMRSIV